MKIITLKPWLLSLLFILGFASWINAQNLVSNGDFESWTGGLPDDWTTIETGIDVSEENAIVNGGSASASVNLLTDAQGDTDFRQTIAVTGGTEYDVSVWVYHTEGGVKARLYVGTYLNYSDNTLTGDWQEITYNFTAAADENIEIGLRFYDVVPLFDGEEIVYVDDYLIEEVTGGGGTGQAIYVEPFSTDLGATSQYSVIGADQVWEYATFGNPPGCAKMTGYDDGAQINEDWLITNVINCNNYSNITLSFDHARNYADNSGLSVLISTDYDGSSDPTSQGTWDDLTSQFTFPTGGWNFIDAGTVDISSLVSSTTYIAFKYVSDDTDAATWEVDNIKVEGEYAAFARIPGSFNDWSTTDPDWVTSPNANGLLELTKNLPAASHEYKVLEGDDWNTDESYPGTNQQIVLSQAEDITWKVNYNSNLVSHTLPTVVGDFVSELGGNDWDPTDPLGEMSDPDGDDVYELEVTIPTAGIYVFKVTLNNNWDQNTAYGFNVPFYANGTDATTFIYSLVDDTILSPEVATATVKFVVNDSDGKNYDGFFLKGSWSASGFYDSNWGDGMEHAAFNDEGSDGDETAGDNIWTCQQELVINQNPDDVWQWGVNDTEHNWVNGNWEFTVPDGEDQTLTWVVPSEPALIINEIMYNSIGTDQEWIELFNNTGSDIDLEGWRLVDSDASHSNIIIPAGYSIASDDYFTIAVEGDDDFPFTPDYDGRGNFALNNSGDDVRLWNADNILVDIVSYSDTDPWPTAPDGDGPALALIDPDTDNSLPENWAASLEEGGTPGEENFPPIPFVSVTNPQGGENIEQGSDFEITWVSGFWDGQIQIELVLEGEEPELLAYNLPLSDNSFMWTVWDEQPVGDEYKVRISGLNDGDPVGESEGYFSIIEPYIAPTIVITEIMYNPPEAGDDSLEFLEFYNNGIDTIDMSDFSISQGVGYVFPMGISLSPDTFLLVAKDSLAMMATMGVEALQWTTGSLSNSGEAVELLDNLGNQVDFVPFEDYLPWDTLADGFGPSLTLCNPFSDNSLPENWTASVNFAAINSDGDSIYATPGFNCQVQLLAVFEGDPTVLPIGDSVMFTDGTIGNPISWEWTFEGGTPATYSGQNPPYIVYNEVGEWDVTLVVNDGSLTDTLTVDNYIHTGVAPMADFEADETVVLAGTFTNFTSLSTGDDLTFEWMFDGGTPETSADENPSEIYYLIMDWDYYDVTLIVTNPFGSDTLTKEDYIEVVPESVNEKILTKQNVNLYPNPNNGSFKISIPVTAEAEVSIMDLRGQLIFSTDISGTGHLDVNGLNKGIYLVKIFDSESGAVVVKRLIIQ